MKFAYRAKDDKGRHQEGIIQAASDEAALHALDRYGFYVTWLREEKEEKALFSRQIRLFERISLKDVMLFSRQLSILFRSQISLVDALGTIGTQMKHRAFREKILQISQEVDGGTALSDALAQHPKVFSPFYINIVKRGEALGNLADVLNYLADHLEREHSLHSKIKGAMTYPIFVLIVAAVVISLLSVLVLPNLTKVLVDSGQELPLVTQIVISSSTFYAQWWWLVSLGAVAFVIGMVMFVKSKRGKSIFQRVILRIPRIGSFAKMIYVTQFGENLSTLIAGGVPIVEALAITGRIVGNEVYQKIIGEAKDSVAQGNRISEVLSRYPGEFPPIFTQMIQVGEKSGALDTTLKEIVSFYQKELERNIDALLSLIEPIMIVALGLLVGGLMASLMLPLYQGITQI